MRISLTPKQIDGARDLRKRGLSYQTIADRIGCAKKTVQFALHPDRREAHRKKCKDRRIAKRSVRGDDEPKLEIPESTRREWLERAKAYASRTDLTAWLMGDPIPGWSALERR